MKNEERLAWWLDLGLGGPRQGEMCGLRACDWSSSHVAPFFGCWGVAKNMPKANKLPTGSTSVPAPVSKLNRLIVESMNRLIEASAVTLLAILVPATIQFPSSRGPFCKSHSLVGRAFPPADGGQLRRELCEVHAAQHITFAAYLQLIVCVPYQYRGHNYPKLSMHIFPRCTQHLQRCPHVISSDLLLSYPSLASASRRCVAADRFC
jgi:hypothetical protein